MSSFFEIEAQLYVPLQPDCSEDRQSTACATHSGVVVELGLAIGPMHGEP